MPKIKTHKTTAKRFKISGTGKLVRRQTMLSHNLTNRTPASKRHHRSTMVVVSGDAKRINRLLAR